MKTALESARSAVIRPARKHRPATYEHQDLRNNRREEKEDE
jgi:hypothetical protein